MINWKSTLYNVRKEVIAAACHTAWYAYTVIGLGESGEPWKFAPDWQKDSILEGVDFWDEELARITKDPNRDDQMMNFNGLIELLAPLTHENWMQHKKKEGWTYGETKDPEKKTHPCMVAYSDLPSTQRDKDIVVLQAYLTMRELLKLD